MTSRTDSDGWSGRLAQLAALTHMDAMAIILPARENPSTYAAYNTSSLAWPNTPAASTVATVLTQKRPVQLGSAAMPLADGRVAESLTAAPVVWRDQLLAVLVGMSTRPAADEDVTTLARAADLVAIDLADANVIYRAQRGTQDVEARMRAARELQRIVRQGDPTAVLDRATSFAGELFSADGVSIMLIEDGELRIQSSRGLSDEAKRSRRAVGDGISGGVARSGQPTLLIGPIAGASDPTVSESMIVPLRAAERTIGVLNVKHRAPQTRYAQPQLDALTAFAQDIASAYTTASELQHAIDDRQQAIVLYELSRLATLGTDPQNDLASAVAMLAGTLRHDAVSVWQHENDKLRLRAATGYEAEPGAEIALEDSDTTLAVVLRERHTARVHVAMTEDRPEWTAPGCTEFLLAPIGAFGVLVFARATAPYSDTEREFSATVAEYVVGMLQRTSAQDVVDRGVATERRRIAQEIHDGLAQELTGVVLALEGCQRAFEKDPSLLGPQLQKAARDARATLADVRQYMAALRQSETGALNLPVTLGRLVDDLRRQTGLQVDMDESGQQRELEPIVERAVIRIVGEALRNVAQHAGAKQAKVALLYGPEGVVATIEDDGRGFDVENTFSSAEARGHFGVVGMRERAEAAGGELLVRSETGHGTIVRASIPYANFVGVPGMTSAPIEDVEPQAVEDHDTSDRGFLGRLFGR